MVGGIVRFDYAAHRISGYTLCFVMQQRSV